MLGFLIGLFFLLFVVISWIYLEYRRAIEERAKARVREPIGYITSITEDPEHGLIVTGVITDETVYDAIKQVEKPYLSMYCKGEPEDPPPRKGSIPIK